MSKSPLLKDVGLSALYTYLISACYFLINEIRNILLCSSTSYCPSYEEFYNSLFLPFITFIYPFFIAFFFTHILIITVLFWTTFILFFKKIFLNKNRVLLLTLVLTLWQIFGYYCTDYMASIY